ncbi:MAG: glycosyltransferase [Bacteroidetes bacterium]|nr:glycosyltransferase [Bacteroidota bacterium]
MKKENSKLAENNEKVKMMQENYEVIQCPYCGSSRADAYRKSADIVKCDNCGTIYLRTRLNKHAMEQLYQTYNTDAPQMFLPKDQAEIKNSLLRRDYWIKEIMKYTKPEGKILDIGCGWGAFLDNARSYGFVPRGIEITKRGVEFAKTKLKIEASSEQFLDTSLEKESFKVITLNHVLEHLPEPKLALEKIYGLLQPGGLFCGIVPNIESICSFLMGEGWEWLDPFYHYVHYSPVTLRKHLENAGFIIERLYTASGDYNRTQLADTIEKYYRPAVKGISSDIISKVELNGNGEEIRFIARKPLTETPVSVEEKDYSIITSKVKHHNSYSASVIIPVYNKVEFTQKCLETIYSVNNGREDFEVIVVNNASSDETEKFLISACEEYHDLKVVNNKTNKGFAGACNAGAAAAEGKVLVFLNNDTMVRENWLSYGINRLLMDESIGIVGSKLLYPDRTIQHSGVEYLLNVHPEYPLWPVHRYLGLKEDDPIVNQPGFVEAVTGACLFISSDLFKSVHGFEEEYVMYFEDLDLCFKILQAGKKIYYEPKSVVIHFEGKSTPDEASRYKMSGSAAVKFYTKWKNEIARLAVMKRENEEIVNNNLPFTLTQLIEANKKTLSAMIESSRYIEAEKLLHDLKKFAPSDPLLKNYELRLDMLNGKNGKHLKTSPSVTSELNEDKKPKVSIITLTYNALNYTKEFIASLQKYTTGDYELIVIDNCSTDGTQSYLDGLGKKYENIKIVLNNENKGFPAAVNQGILESRGEYIVVANNDIVFTDQWLEKMIESAASDNKIGMVGPISNIVSGVQIDKDTKYTSLDGMHEYASSISAKNKNEKLFFPRIAFLCTLIKKEVIDKIGGLDERFSPGNYEDDDFCLRAQLAGFKTVIAKDVFIHHYGSKSFKADGEKKYAERLEVNKKKFVEKWGTTPDEIWLQNKNIQSRQIFYPINKNLFTQYFERVRVHIADQEFLLALNALDESLENFSSAPASGSKIEYDALLNLTGNIALITGDTEKAKTCFEEELGLVPGSSSACVGLGEVFFMQGMYDNAKIMFEWAVKNNPQNLTAVSSLAKVNELLGYSVDHVSVN